MRIPQAKGNTCIPDMHDRHARLMPGCAGGRSAAGKGAGQGFAQVVDEIAIGGQPGAAAGTCAAIGARQR